MSLDLHVSLWTVGIIIAVELIGIVAVLWWLERQR